MTNVTKLKPVKPAAGTPIRDGESYAMEDGSLVVPPEMLKRFGNGSVEDGRRELRFLIEAEHDREIRLGPTAAPPNVRIATPADEEAILELLLLDVEENAKRIAQVDPERIMSHIRLATQLRGFICGVIDGPDGKPVAVNIMAPMQWWFSKEWYYQEVVSFVHPDHRKSRYAHDLIAFMRSVGDLMSTKYGHRVYVLLGVLGLKRTRAKIAMMRRKMRQVGAAFLYPCPYDDDEKMT